MQAGIISRYVARTHYIRFNIKQTRQEWTSEKHLLDGNLCVLLQIGCASEDGAGLHPKTTKVFCHRENPSRWPSYGDASLLFADCRTLKLSIHSRIYDIQEAILINFSVVGPGRLKDLESYNHSLIH